MKIVFSFLTLVIVFGFNGCGKFDPQVSATLSSTLDPADAYLAWDANSEPDLISYRIYYGTDPANLRSTIEVPRTNMPDYVIRNLSPGTYYFVVTALNSSGESNASNMVSKVIR